MSEQLYLIKISAMMTSEECDVVPSAQFVTKGDFDPQILSNLKDLAKSFASGMKGIPLTGVRPMTREEIREWQKEQDESEDDDDWEG